MPAKHDFSYELLKEVHDAVERLESKIDNRLNVYDVRLNKVESKLDNLLGKAALGFVIFMSIFGTSVTFMVEWVKNGLRGR